MDTKGGRTEISALLSVAWLFYSCMALWKHSWADSVVEWVVGLMAKNSDLNKRPQNISTRREIDILCGSQICICRYSKQDQTDTFCCAGKICLRSRGTM